MLGCMSYKLESRKGGRNINNLRYADDATLNGRKQRGIKEPLDEGEGEDWNKHRKIKY